MDKINVGELFGNLEDLQLQAEVQALKHRNYQLEHDISSQRDYIKHLENQIEQLSETKKEVKYRVVRSYTSGNLSRTTELKQAFFDGYEFVRASEVVESSDGNFIEYILRKEVEVDE